MWVLTFLFRKEATKYWITLYYDELSVLFDESSSSYLLANHAIFVESTCF